MVVLVGLLSFVVSVFGSDSLSGASQMTLIVSTGFCLLLATCSGHMQWKEFERELFNKVAGMSQAIIILLLIGTLSATWMMSGVVPTLITYGLELMNPTLFLASACLICAIVSVLTGSSWTTIATIGIALIGIGQTMGYDHAWIAGAIISGAYFGDKVSPMSDTTILASSVIGTPLFEHIRYMMYTTIPTFTISLVIFLVLGFCNTPDGGLSIAEVQNALASQYNVNLWLLLVPVATGVMIARRMPALVVLFLSSVLACVFAFIFQPHLLEQVAGGEGVSARLTGLLISAYGSTAIDIGVPELNDLVATRGMGGMLPTVWLILCAVTFGAAMDAAHMLQSIMQAVLRSARSVVSLVTGTAFTGLFLNAATGDQYLSIMLTGNMFAPAYRDMGLESRLLSRTVEDSTTVTSVLVPWNTCGLAQSTVLGVSTLTYLPFCFFNILSPLTTIVVAWTGWKIVRKK